MQLSNLLRLVEYQVEYEKLVKLQLIYDDEKERNKIVSFVRELLLRRRRKKEGRKKTREINLKN